MPERFSAKYWQERAEEATTLAATMSDGRAKESMLRIADEYEKLAARAAGHEKDDKRDRATRRS